MICLRTIFTGYTYYILLLCLQAPAYHRDFHSTKMTAIYVGNDLITSRAVGNIGPHVTSYYYLYLFRNQLRVLDHK